MMLKKRIIPCLDVKYGDGNRALVAKGTIYVPSMIAVSKRCSIGAAVRIYESLAKIIHWSTINQSKSTI